jgi:Tol biopolymer transport system component
LRVAGAALAAYAGFLLPGAAGLAPAAPEKHASKVAYVRDSLTGQRSVFVVAADGSGRHRTTLPSLPHASRDGRKLAFVRDYDARPSRLFVADRDGAGRRPILRRTTYGGCVDPVWSPDSKRLLYTTDCDVDFQAIGVVNSDGGGRRMLTKNWSQNPDWSPDGRMIVFTSVKTPYRSGFQLFLMDARGRGRRVIAGRYPGAEPTPNAHSGPTWSPDGRRIFFLSDGLWVINRGGTGAPQADAETREGARLRAVA